MSGKPVIWVSEWDRGMSYATRFGWTDKHNDIHNKEEVRGHVERTNRYCRGERIDPDWLPKTASVDCERNYKSLQDVMRIMRYLIASAKTRALFEQYEIGDSQFSPVRLFRKNGRDAYEGEYFVFNLTQVRAAAVVERCETKYLLDDGRGVLEVFDPKIVIDADKVGDADIWLDVGLSRGGVYFSDRLRKACKGHIKGLRFRKVEVV